MLGCSVVLRDILPMTMPDEQALLDLFVQLLPPERWRELEGKKRLDRVYSLKLVVAMALLQRLDERGTQQEVVHQLAVGKLEGVARCERVRKGEISSNTGAYARACGRTPYKLVEQVCDEILQELGKRIEPLAEQRRPVLALDGTSISLEHTSGVLRRYPPNHNQYGEAHWGMLRLVALHDLRTGIALRPQWGPMYGPQTVSEQQLAEQALEQAPAESVILGDGNFGIFYLAYKVDQSQRKLIFRLTEQRGKSMGAGALLPRGERRICWRPTRKDREKHPELPPDAQIEGRLMARTQNGFRRPLYLFTTLADEPAAVVACYAQRWNIELDLRTLKRTLRLHHLRGKSESAVEKELLIAVIAYGLVRAFMALAARRAGLPPRQISFTCAYSLVDKSMEKLCSQHAEERERAFDRMLAYIAKSKLPKRSKPRAYPRAVWGFRPTFPPRETVAKSRKDCK
jgi:hypothetical protein